MDQTFSQQSSMYVCDCQKDFIPADLLSDHLNLPRIHHISKVNPELPSSKYFQTSILNKIDSVVKIQVEIQQSSFNLTQTILINTNLVLTKLDHLVKLYRNILSDPPKSSEIQSREIVSSLNVDGSFNEAMIRYFKQSFVAERLTVDRKIEIIKSKVKNLFSKRGMIFWSLALFNSQNFIVTGGLDGFIRVWDTKSKSQIGFYKKHTNIINALAINSEDEILLSGSHDCSVRLWDLKSMKHLHKFEGHTDIVRSVLISKNSKIGISGSFDQSFKVWNLEKKEIKLTLSVEYLIFELFLFSDDQKLAVAGSKGLYIWNLKNHFKKRILNKSCRAITFSKDETFFIVGNDEGSIQIWVLENMEMVFEDKKHNNYINKISISDDSQYFATCSYDKKLIIWNLLSRKVDHSIDFDYPFYNTIFFKDCETLAITELTSISFFKIKSISNKNRISLKEFNYRLITISSDLQFIAYGARNLVLFDLEKSAEVSKISHKISEFSFLKFTPDSNYLGCGFFLGEVQILKVTCLTQIYKLNLCQSRVDFLAFTINAKLVANVFSEKMLIVQSIENNKTVYVEKNIQVESAIFCLSSKRLVYLISQTIIVMDKNFIKVAVLKVKNDVYNLFLSGNNRTILAAGALSRWSGIDSATLKILFDDRSKKDLKYSRAKDPKLRLLMFKPRINFS